MTTTEKVRSNVHYEIIPGFSALKMKRELQEIVRRETEGMTGDEILEYFRKGSEEFQADMEERRAKAERERIAGTVQ